MSNQERFIRGSFVTIICLGFLFGKLMAESVWGAFAGLGWTFAVWFIGAVIGHMHCIKCAATAIKNREDEIEEELKSRQSVLDLEAEELVRKKKRMFKGYEGQTRAICDRAVNRVLSKWVPNLGDEVRRDIVFRDVEEIISEEFERESGIKRNSQM